MSSSYCFGLKGRELGSWKLFLISLSSMLGVGVFLKSKTLSELSHFEIWPILALFCLAGFLIISMTFVFTKLVKQHSLSGRSFIEWVEEYCGLNFRNWAIRFTRDFAQPIGLITTSLYLLQWIMGESFLWVWESAVLALLLGGAISTLTAFSFKWAERLQRCLSCCIFITMIVFTIFGVISIFRSDANNGNGAAQQLNTAGFNSLSGWTIMLSGLPSIFFMYDGFYSVLALKTRAKAQIAFSKLVLYSMAIVTLLYFALIAISLLGDKKGGDFLNFYNLKNDKNLKDVLTILIMLTFLSSLNVSTICGSNQLVNLYLKYNFNSFNSLKRQIINRGKHLKKFGIETRLSVWLFLLKRIVIIALTLAAIAQLNYWISSSDRAIFWQLNDTLAELNSLVIFCLLGIVIWIASFRELSYWAKPLYRFSSLSIFVGAIYYILNSLYSFISTHQIIYLFKLIFLGITVIAPAFPWLKTNWVLITRKKYNLIRQSHELKGSFNLLFLGAQSNNPL
ncbi:amino acid permease [Candidatus Mycoplasma haematominutum]|uniref:Amino acid permease n=1 Tax=Candidatus Mycoplasma haematominutum 'Birmingham 1' TaxID=1116213 RepID=G8C351_9MOLU|nr:amino acid permease [Candidatus Mycoplasma haematominutum]CCE66749.1 amino acid permease [Candidatus Mycoplasma haematominutum 'Birmingham 1']